MLHSKISSKLSKQHLGLPACLLRYPHYHSLFCNLRERSTPQTLPFSLSPLPSYPVWIPRLIISTILLQMLYTPLALVPLLPPTIFFYCGKIPKT